MNAYEYLKQGAIVPVTMDAIRDLVELGKQQADRIGVLEANHEIQKNINDKALQYIAELEKDLHMTERHYERLHTQTKPLSDDEIEQLREYHGINDWLYETSVTDFARAIEERHGIK